MLESADKVASPMAQDSDLKGEEMLCSTSTKNQHPANPTLTANTGHDTLMSIRLAKSGGGRQEVVFPVTLHQEKPHFLIRQNMTIFL